MVKHKLKLTENERLELSLASIKLTTRYYVLWANKERRGETVKWEDFPAWAAEGCKAESFIYCTKSEIPGKLEHTQEFMGQVALDWGKQLINLHQY